VATGPELLAAYDHQLRGDTEALGALKVEHLGPLWLVTFAGGEGFISYQQLDGLEPEELESLISRAVGYFRAEQAVAEIEWKTRSHDRAPHVHELLVLHGFTPDEPESIMIGEARSLAIDVPLPDGVTLRQVTEASDVRAMTAMQNEVFGDPPTEDRAERLIARLEAGDQFDLWVAEFDGQIVSAGRIDPVLDSDFASIWGGATRPEWRGRGIYRALTAARARSALSRGKTLIHSDSTEYSRPILERSGLVAVSTTTPYRWKRQG
jgi:ribosomal protein S18 acetylase RimI-like enzyme